MANSRKLRFGVCGTAVWAETIHIPGLLKAPDAELVAVYGRNEARVAELAGRFGLTGQTDFAAFLDQVDAVSFAVPPDVQAGLALKAARAGKALLLEKPPATTRDDADALWAEIDARGLAATCFLTRRYIPALAAHIAEGAARRPERAEAVFRSGAMLGGSAFAGSLWRQGEGAALWDLGPHVLTFLLGVMGPVAEVSARGGPDGTILADLVHRAGGRSTLDVGIAVPAERQCETYGFTADGAGHVLPRPDFDRIDALAIAAGEITAPGAGSDRAASAFTMMPVLLALRESFFTGKPVTLS